jgi:hypothetical protein
VFVVVFAMSYIYHGATYEQGENDKGASDCSDTPGIARDPRAYLKRGVTPQRLVRSPVAISKTCRNSSA